MDVTGNGSIVLSEWKNSLSQILYFHYFGANSYRVFNTLTKTPLGGNSTVTEGPLQYNWSSKLS
jgi:hypothetical protein